MIKMEPLIMCTTAQHLCDHRPIFVRHVTSSIGPSSSLFRSSSIANKIISTGHEKKGRKNVTANLNCPVFGVNRR